jgi:hypothetical protein
LSTYADVGLSCLAHAESRISGLEVEVIRAELSGENEKQVFNASFFSNIGLIISTAGSFDQRRFFYKKIYIEIKMLNVMLLLG